jgi:hypothetical protein
MARAPCFGSCWALTARCQSRAEFIQCDKAERTLGPECRPAIRSRLQSFSTAARSADHPFHFLPSTQRARDRSFSPPCCSSPGFCRQHRAAPRRAHAPRSDPIALHHDHHARPSPRRSADFPLVNPHPDSRPHPCPVSLSATPRLPLATPDPAAVLPSSPSIPCRPSPSIRGPPSPMLCLDHHGGAS